MIRTDDFALERIPAPLILWYQANKRVLPFRENPTPYRVWVSEIMLQQTRVEAAKDYFLRFMEALPDVFALAEVEEEKLLKLWEGLGYYSRARNLQKAAKMIAERGGEFPRSVKELQTLPGIGAYTAGAIASIAFGQREPAVDGNVFRVLSRLMANGTPINDPKYKAYLEERLRAVYPVEGAPCSDFTQALMELGAMVCKPSSPECDACPLAAFCKAKEAGEQTAYPVMAEKKEPKKQKLYVFFIKTAQGVCIRKRTAGVLKGMYEFPSHEIVADETPESVLDKWGMYGFTIQKGKRYTHVFSHIKWEIESFFVTANDAPFEQVQLPTLKEEISLPTAFRQMLKTVEESV